METQEKRKRRFLLALPILIIPFLAFGFYALGGGVKENARQTSTKGINTDLPDAKFKKEDPKDKFGFYAEAGKDTINSGDNAIQDVANRFGYQSKDEDPQAEQIDQKLEALNREINKPYRPVAHPGTANASYSRQSGNLKSDVDRLEALMKNMQTSSADDPEMQQLGDMMEKILDIQHPQRLKEKYETQTQSLADSEFKALPVVIDGNQKITYGATIRLRLQDTIHLNGQTIPKNQLLFGTAVISNQRVLLDIKTVRLGSSIIPVNLTVYGLDGLKGINAPEAVLTEAASSGANDALRSIQLLSMDQSLVSQVAGAGVDAAKSLFSKKLKRIKVKLKGGEPLLLRNNEARKIATKRKTTE